MSDSGFCNPSPWRGTTSGTATSPALVSEPRLINSFRIINNTGGSISVNVYLFNGSSQVSIAPNPISLSAGQMYEETQAIVQLATEQIKVQTSGSIDYDFTQSNIPIQ